MRWVHNVHIEKSFLQVVFFSNVKDLVHLVLVLNKVHSNKGTAFWSYYSFRFSSRLHTTKSCRMGTVLCNFE
jgi:hypothetical protein